MLSRAWDEQKEKENSKGHRTGQLLHIAFMVFITFDLFYTGLSSWLELLSDGMRNAVLIPPFSDFYLLLVAGS